MNISTISFGLLCIVAFGNLYPQSTDSLALNPSIRYGKLENGFTYYLKSLPDSGEKVNMQLIVKAGNNYEEKDQMEMAHFLEHLTFIRTKHFTNLVKNTSLLNEFQMQSNDIRGVTGREETTYFFNYPSRNRKALDGGLLFFKDIASGHIKFHKEDIDAERGVFFQESLYSDKASYYAETKALNLVTDCVKNLIATENYHQYIKTFKVEPLQRFYKDWYYPERMALIMVGNIKNIQALESKIKTTFGNIKKGISKEHIDCNKNYLTKKNQFVVVRDSIQPNVNSRFNFFIKNNHSTTEKRLTMQNKTTNDLVVRLINARLEKESKGYNVPYQIVASTSWLPAIKIKVQTPQASEKEAIQKAFSILYKIREYGFTKKELKDYKQKEITRLNTIDTLHGSYWTNKFGAHFIKGQSLLANNPTISKKKLNNLSLLQVNNFIKEYLQEIPHDVVMIIPKNRKTKPDENEIKQWISHSKDSIHKNKITVPPSKQLPTDSLKFLPDTHLKYKGKDKLGAQQYLLENGIKLILKAISPSSEAYQDKIIMHGFSAQGANSFSGEDYYAALLAPSVVRNAGVGKMNKFELEDYLNGSELSYRFRTYIDPYESGIKGEIKLEELETALKLVYLHMTVPRWDKEAFKDWQMQEENYYTQFHGHLRVKANLLNKVQEALGTYAPVRKSSLYNKKTKSLDFEKSYKVYKTIMGNPEEFTFVFTGSYSLEKILPLLIKYLGNLPKLEDKKNIELTSIADDNKVKTPKEIIFNPYTTIENAHIHQTFLKQSAQSIPLKEQIEFDLLTHILNYKLQELRYANKRAIYVSLARNQIDRKRNHQLINLMLSCGKEDLPIIREDIQEIILNIKQQGVSENLFQKIWNSHIIPKYKDEKLNSHKHIAQSIYEHYRFQKPYYSRSKIKRVLQSIERNDIQNIAKKYLDNQLLVNCIAKSDLHN